MKLLRKGPVRSSLFSLVMQARAALKAEGALGMMTKIYRYVGMRVFGLDFYQKPVIDCICSHAAKHRTFIDVGAHIGIITTAVAHLFERCLAIEPSPQNITQLRRAVQSKRLKNCQVIACALGDRVGFATLYLSESDTNANSLAKREDLGKGIQVPVTTLDLLVEETGTTGPFLIKIDIEGYELFVLRGAERTLAKECTVISEFWTWGLESAGCKAKDYLEFMKERGYTACELKGHPVRQSKLVRLLELGKDDRSIVTDLLFSKTQAKIHMA